jgi:hypothetical protein
VLLPPVIIISWEREWRNTRAFAAPKKEEERSGVHSIQKYLTRPAERTRLFFPKRCIIFMRERERNESESEKILVYKSNTGDHLIGSVTRTSRGPWTAARPTTILTGTNPLKSALISPLSAPS